ncbi:uncharacterized protein LOC131849720 [Achroia grisella]|uniref:uncharacterized protein LOC131849720 n=1 Tax=Achroia grisella TaxID=688607 RepID=UPI0027D24E3F|nr:uncharacterized protein LOC131849720 [Achroia grisella]
MLEWLLVLVMHQAVARDYYYISDTPHNINYTTIRVENCPDVGYFFQRELTPNTVDPGPCRLCFCQGSGTAVCWVRENRRCDVEGYHHHHVGRRQIDGARVRRSPVGLSDIFFKDAARQVFNRDSPEVCKPYESSFSEGCPPTDWCTGCTVCDCDANGHWDCHILSFCDDDKKKKKAEKTRKSPKKIIKQSQPSVKTISKLPKQTTRLPNQTYKRPKPKQMKGAAVAAKFMKKGRTVKEKGISASPRPKIIKKDITAKNEKVITYKKPQKNSNASDIDAIAQEVVKRVITAMRKLIRNQVNASLPNIIKTVQKRSMEQFLKDQSMNNNRNKGKYKILASHRKQYNKTLPVKKNKPLKSGIHRNIVVSKAQSKDTYNRGQDELRRYRRELRQPIENNIYNIYQGNETTTSTRSNTTSTRYMATVTENSILNYTKSDTYSTYSILTAPFRKIFYKPKNKTMNGDLKINKHTIESLCESFGPCTVTNSNSVVLQKKLKKLNGETFSIMKTIFIIKGLLKLLELPLYYKKGNADSSDNKTSDLTNDIKKLNTVLRMPDVNNDYGNKLSETQKTQTYYIKNNTKVFIASVRNFIYILNDVVGIITSTNERNNQKPYGNYQGHKMSITDNLNSTNAEPFRKLQNILLKYNFMQNKFIRKMYNMLSKFQRNVFQNDTKRRNFYNKQSVKENDNSKAIDNFSRNIIVNLRKLNNLARTLNTRGRKKREILKGDDGIEYLLMLMEYLIKQNYPIRTAPVNDGIDLILEAIKNAPDIKSVKKKVLDTNTTSKPIHMPREDSISDNSNRISKEDNFRSTLNDFNSKNAEQFQDVANLNIYKNGKEVENKTDLSVYENTITQVSLRNNDYTEEPVSELPFEYATNERNSSGVTQFDGHERDNEKKLDIFSADFNDENDIGDDLTSTTLNSNSDADNSMSSTQIPDTTTEIKQDKIIMRHFIAGTANDSIKSKIAWADEDYSDETGNVTDITTDPLTLTKMPKKGIQNISSISSEVQDTKKLSHLNTEEIISKKERDFLNSLDYGTERSLLEESDSKDNVEDRFSSDSFPSYFV